MFSQSHLLEPIKSADFLDFSAKNLNSLTLFKMNYWNLETYVVQFIFKYAWESSTIPMPHKDANDE